MLPDGDAAAAVELTQGQLHVEEGHPPEHCHQHVGQKEGTWERRGKGRGENDDESSRVKEGEVLMGEECNSVRVLRMWKKEKCKVYHTQSNRKTQE